MNLFVLLDNTFSSWSCCVASAKQTSRLCFWSSNFLSRQRLSSSRTSNSCSRARHLSSSSSARARSFPSSCRVTSKLLSKSITCDNKIRLIIGWNWRKIRAFLYLFLHLMQLQLYSLSLLDLISQSGLQLLFFVLSLGVVLVAFLQLVLRETKLLLQLQHVAFHVAYLRLQTRSFDVHGRFRVFQC